MSRAERDTLFHKCANTMTPASITNWFLRAPGRRILRENVAEWLLWALFCARPTEVLKEWEEELDSYISVMGDYVGYPIGRGINFDMQCLRPTMDPVHMIHRPFIWYTVRLFLASKPRSTFLTILGADRWPCRYPGLRCASFPRVHSS